MKKWLKILIPAAVVLLLLPFVIVSVIAFGLPAQYSNTFLGELPEKFELLKKTDEPKIVIIGGSSVAFGIDSPMIEEYTERKVVNFGLYATIGTKAMIDLSKANINAGDIVILAPEMDAQTLSLYFNEDTVWQGIDGHFGMLPALGSDNYGAMFSGVWNFAARKYDFYKTKSAPNPEGVYNKSSFNDHGDIIYPREYNIMVLGYDPTTTITLDPSIVDGKFIDYVNKYIHWCEKKGAQVFFSFSPMNREALAEGTDDNSIYNFYSYLASMLDCEIMTNINDCIMDWEYFYDTNFHLNDVGVKVHTAALISDIRRSMANPQAFTIELPEKPERPDVYVDSSLNDTTGFFLYEVIDGVQTLVGVTDLGKQQEKLTMPMAYNGLAVQTMAANALAGCDKLTEFTIPSDTKLKLINNGGFAGAPNLKKVYLRCLPDDVLVGTEGLMEGASADLKFYVPRENYGDYAAHYFWSNYINIITIST